MRLSVPDNKTERRYTSAEALRFEAIWGYRWHVSSGIPIQAPSAALREKPPAQPSAL